jgi:TPP-dependent pyruvate/acetoin dehydrogenase alpha subunit
VRAPPGEGGAVSTLDLLQAYRTMLLIRQFELAAAELRTDGRIICSLHLCNGQEAIAVGARSALRPGDTVVATYRGHHWGITWGIPLDALMAEFMGGEAGVNGGRAGAGLFVAPEHGFLGEIGIVGGGCPIAVGVGLASIHDGSDRVSLVAFGDGALNQGAVHEAMSFAAIYDLPVIFVCENNGYSEYTVTSSMFRIGRLSDRAAAYGFPGEHIDGDDPAAVFETVGAAADRAREGGGPTLIEAVTHRLEGHHTHDPQHYRSRDERVRWAELDALVRLRSRLATDGVATEQELGDIERAVRAEVADAIEAASASPPADPARLLEQVYG